jgi:hypothetical protein
LLVQAFLFLCQIHDIRSITARVWPIREGIGAANA